MFRVGLVSEIVRYPVKSMAGIPVESADIGWHGIKGDRRFAFRRLGDTSGMPWLTASRLPELLLYHPTGVVEHSDEPLPTHVRTPNGVELEVDGDELKSEIAGRFKSPIELMRLRHGIFDETPLSIISLATIQGIGREAGVHLDPRRFRANILVETSRTDPFHEDAWVGETLVFGDQNKGPAAYVTVRDERCKMVNLDPENAEQDSRVMKTVVRLNNNYAGVYATVASTGVIRVGDNVWLSSGSTPGR